MNILTCHEGPIFPFITPSLTALPGEGIGVVLYPTSATNHIIAFWKINDSATCEKSSTTNLLRNARGLFVHKAGVSGGYPFYLICGVGVTGQFESNTFGRISCFKTNEGKDVRNKADNYGNVGGIIINKIIGNNEVVTAGSGTAVTNIMFVIVGKVSSWGMVQVTIDLTAPTFHTS
jgi:hypothetical protein